MQREDGLARIVIAGNVSVKRSRERSPFSNVGFIKQPSKLSIEKNLLDDEMEEYLPPDIHDALVMKHNH